MTGIVLRTAEVADAEAIERLRVSGWQTAYRGVIPDEFLDVLTPDVARRQELIVTRSDGPSYELVAISAATQIVGWTAGGPSRDPDSSSVSGGEVMPAMSTPGSGAEALVRD